MTFNRYARRKDESQDAIVKALRDFGASVELIGRPVDALVGYNFKTLLMEFKTPGTQYGKRLNDNQRSFSENWTGGPVCMVDNPEAAVSMVKLLVK